MNRSTTASLQQNRGYFEFLKKKVKVPKNLNEWNNGVKKNGPKLLHDDVRE